MIKKEFPILEFDGGSEPMLTPAKIVKPINIPECCVMTFFPDVLDNVLSAQSNRLIYEIPCAIGKIAIYEIEFNGKKVAITLGGLGAPMAAANLEMFAELGCRKFIACGGAGVLVKDLPRGSVILPHEAVRDEGTSYHYITPSRTITLDKEVLKTCKSVLEKHGVNCLIGKTWTTDAFFRETVNKIELRRSEGCLTVEMECAALAAVAEYRKLKFGQLIGAGDDLSGIEWDSRYCNEKSSHNEKLFWLAVECCVTL